MTLSAEELKALYERQLTEDLEPPVAGHVDRLGTRRLLTASRRMPPGELREQDHPAVWIWSDLHLSHAASIHAFGRPFYTPAEMDDLLFGRWCRTVGPDDVIVCLGDVALRGLFGSSLRRLRESPGRKVLVLGNHDVSIGSVVVADGFAEVCSTLYVAGDPPLLMTHMPLGTVPEGCVNVHGHLHGARVPGRTRHINVSVEQVHYRPRPLTAIRRLALRIVAGDTVPGRTTAHQLSQVS